MSWVYPIGADSMLNWTDMPAGYGYAEALADGDDQYIFTPAGILTNSILLDMGTLCRQCEIRARRGAGLNNTASLTITFYDNSFVQSQEWVINLTSYPDWTNFAFLPDFYWRYATLQGLSVDVMVAVSVLRGEEIPTEKPRRTLVGVGW